MATPAYILDVLFATTLEVTKEAADTDTHQKLILFQNLKKLTTME